MSIRESKYRKQIHLAAHFPGVNNTTVWSDTTAGSQIDFASFVHLAQTAERGLRLPIPRRGYATANTAATSTTPTSSAGPVPAGGGIPHRGR